MNKLLITFGCSWMYGIGVGYTSGMTKKDYNIIRGYPELCDPLSFRGLLSKKYSLQNKNFSECASSNQRQFRLAKEFFSSTEFNKLNKEFDKIIVLWGITSTARNELFLINHNKLVNFFYHDNCELSKVIIKHSYNHDNEVDQLATEMHHWNSFFNNLGISNLWFDTFNHHNYKLPTSKIPYFQELYKKVAGKDWPSWDDYFTNQFKVDDNILQDMSDTSKWRFSNAPFNNLIFEDTTPRDLLSILAINNGLNIVDSKYHKSNWLIDTNRVEYLEANGILNPISKHPTKLGHEQIVDILSEHIEKIL